MTTKIEAKPMPPSEQLNKVPFHFNTRVHLKELTGLRANNLNELLTHIRQVPGSVIYHHTHHFLQQHQYLSPEPPNDFAYWASQSLRNDELAERLASIGTVAFSSIRELRDKIVEVIDKTIKEHPDSCEKKAALPFYFIRSISFVLPTPYYATNLQEFLEFLKKVSVDSLYYHIFEARLRLEHPTNDFSKWLENNLNENELAAQINRLDPYTYTMEGLRARLIEMIQKRIKRTSL